MVKAKHRRKPFINTVFHKLCSSLIFGLCIIAGLWIAIVYILVVHGDSASESEPALRGVARETISTDCPVPTVPIDRKLVKVLIEMDMRDPSPEHEAFLQKYISTKRE